MTTDKHDLGKLREAAEWAIAGIDPEESWHTSEEWWAEDGRVRKYVAAADPHIILALIADLEAAEEGVETWKGLATDGTLTGLRMDLAAAGKVIEAQHGAPLHYEAMGSEEYAMECIGGLISCRTDRALALYDDWKRRDTDADQD